MDTMLSNTALVGPLEVAKFVLFAVYIAATIGVIIGVYWEGEQFPKEKQQRGWRLLISSLAVDTLFTILIFGTDGWIGAIQRSEIIALETRLAPRMLSDAQVAEIAKALALFAGQEFDIVTYWEAKEPSALANRIYEALTSAEWKYIKPQTGEFLMGGIEGVQIWSHPDADKPTKEAVARLVTVLTGEHIAARAKDQNPTNNLKHNKITVDIGTKP